MIEMIVMMGGKGGELFPLTKATVQTNVINDYPQYGDSDSISVSCNGLSIASFNYNSTALKISRFVSGAWVSEENSTVTNPNGLSFNEDGTKLFVLTSSEVLIYERSGSTWSKSTVVGGVFDSIKCLSNRNGVATFKNNEDGTFTVKVYTKPSSTWALLQTITITGNYCAFNVSSNGDYIVTYDGAGTTTKTYVTYKWNGSSFAANGNATVSVPSGGSTGSHWVFAISNDGATLVITSAPVSGGTIAIVVKYSGGSWSQVATPGFSIPVIENGYITISEKGMFVLTNGQTSSYAYRLSSAGTFISKHTLTPAGNPSNVLGDPVINSSESEIYTPLFYYGSPPGPIDLLINKR